MILEIVKRLRCGSWFATFEFPRAPTEWEPRNEDIYKSVGSLPNGGAAWDPFRNAVGTHHQKMVVLIAQGELIAYAGGIDLHPSRANWTDCQCRVTGPAAFDLYLSFFERWLAVCTEKDELKGREDPGPAVRHPPVVYGPPDPRSISPHLCVGAIGSQYER